MEDMRMTGKRNPYSSDFKIGLDEDMKIIAYEAHFIKMPVLLQIFHRQFWNVLYFIAPILILFQM